MVKRIIAALTLFVTDPGLFFYKLYAKIRPLPARPVTITRNGVKFEFDFEFDPQIKQMFYGFYETQTIKVLERFLKKDDVFFDIGANIGYVSSIALGLVGKSGQVHSFEPVPEYFKRLNKLPVDNNEYNIFTNQCALGEKESFAEMSLSNLNNIGWNTLVPGFMPEETIRQRITVPVRRLDNYIKEKTIKKISLIKIDTEGFEFPVLKGLNEFFTAAKDVPAIICEIAPTAYPFLGYTVGEMFDYVQKFGYQAFALNDLNKRLRVSELKETTNVIFIKHLKRKNDA